MKMKQIIIGLVALIILSVGGFFAYSFFTQNSDTQGTDQQNKTNTNIFGEGGDTILPTIERVGEPIPTTKLLSVASSTFYSIKYYIPDEDQRAASDMTAQANRWIADTGAAEIKTEAQARELGISKGGCPGYTYEADYEKYASGEYVSYVYSAYDFTCGAHGSSYDIGFTYDKKTGTKIQYLDEIYKENVYEFLSTYARQRLPATLQREGVDVADIQDMFDEGTSPSRENFTSFYFSGNTLYIIFGQYSIGPYVIGIHTLPVPLSLLESYKK
jgi:hypothetical protein